MSNVKSLLSAAIAGDVTALSAIRNVPQDELVEAAREMHLVLTPDSLARVLRQLRSHEIEGTDAQRWASLVRWGLGGRASGPVQTIDVEYQSDYDQEIADIVGRLEEIGDIVDGDVPTGDEISRYLAALGSGDADGKSSSC